MKKYMTGKLVFIGDSGYFGILTEQQNIKEFHGHDSFDILHNNVWVPIVMYLSPDGWEFFCLNEGIMNKMPLMGIEIRYLPEEADEKLPF